MLSNAPIVGPDEAFDADVCIIGSGPAGLTLANELATISDRLQIVVLESGDADPPPEPDPRSDMEIDSPWFPSPAGSRRHQLGGMVPSWNSYLLDGRPAARYLPLDPIDFEDRYWVPNSGWPFDHQTLVPFYDRARTVCGVSPFDVTAPISSMTDRPELRSTSGALVTRLDQLGPSTAFTHVLLAEVTGRSGVRLFTNASAVSVSPGDSTDSGSSATVRVRSGAASFRVRSRVVVIACGAIAAARLLLSSTDFHPAGLGNQNDNVGRYFMDHPRITFGHGFLPRSGPSSPMGLYERHERDGQQVIGKLKLSEAVMRRERLVNGNAQIYPHFMTAEQMRSVAAARRAARTVRDRGDLRSLPRDLRIAGSQAASIAWTTARARLVGGDHTPRSGGETWLGTRPRSYKVNFQPEQVPVRSNRVTLGERLDPFGLPVPLLHWRWSDEDLTSIRRTRELFSEELEACGLGPLLDEEWPPTGEVGGQPVTAHHHLGTTRMHDDQRRGVVDRNGRIHGVDRVYVTGGSVFPTAGNANPTLTVVALALRLADELGRVLGR